MTDKLKDKLHEKAEQEVEVRGHKMEKADIFKFVGLIAFFAIMVLIVVMLWPYFHELFEPGGLDRIINDVRGAGPVGFLILLGLQFLQIVVAFIPGEVVQIAAACCTAPGSARWSFWQGASFPARSSSRWCTSWGRRSCRAWCPCSTSKSSASSRKPAS